MRIAKFINYKKRWRRYKARTQLLPAHYRAAIEAIERYLLVLGPADGSTSAAMFEDLADLFEQSAAAGTSVRAIVGADPVEFAEAFLRNYPHGQWIVKERERLTKGIDRAADTPA